MSFHKQIDPTMAHAVTTNAAILPNRIEIVELPGTGIFAKFGAVLAAIGARFGQSSRLPSINTLPNHLRQDIGLGPLGSGYHGRGCY